MGSSISEYFYISAPSIPPVTGVERTKAALLDTRNRIRTRKLHLTSAIENTKKLIRDSLRKKLRNLAVRALREQKSLERRLQFSEDQLAQVELLIVDIGQQTANSQLARINAT